MSEASTVAKPKAEHTPGPWTVEFPERPDAMSEVFAPKASADDFQWRVAYVLRDSNPHQQPVDDANARLIAAAPDLLAAAKDAYIALPMTKHNKSINDALAAAIAKAEGRS